MSAHIQQNIRWIGLFVNIAVMTEANIPIVVKMIPSNLEHIQLPHKLNIVMKIPIITISVKTHINVVDVFLLRIQAIFYNCKNQIYTHLEK